MDGTTTFGILSEDIASISSISVTNFAFIEAINFDYTQDYDVRIR